METGVIVLAAYAAVLVAGCVVTFMVGRRQGQAAEAERLAAAKAGAEDVRRRAVEEAEREAENLRKSALVSGKEELIKQREAWEVEARRRRDEIERDEKRVQERETVLDRKFDVLDQRDREIGTKSTDLGRRSKVLEEREAELDRLVTDERRRLEQLAGMSAQDAKALLMQRMEEEAQAAAANRLREIRESSKRTADREAKKIVAIAVQRIAA